MDMGFVYIGGALIIAGSIYYFAKEEKKYSNSLRFGESQLYRNLEAKIETLQIEMSKKHAGYKSVFDLQTKQFDSIEEKLKTVEFMAHSAKMDIAKGINQKQFVQVEPIKVYHFRKAINKEESSRHEIFSKVSKQLDGLK